RLLPHHENGKRIRQHGCAATTATALLLRVLGCIGGGGGGGGRPRGGGADGQGGEDFSLVGMEHHHGGGVVASGEEDMILDVECQPAGPATLAGKIILGGHLECLGVHGGNLILVFQIDVQVTFSVGDGLLRSAAQIERAHDGTGLGVDHRRVGLAVTENPDPLVEWVEEN